MQMPQPGKQQFQMVVQLRHRAHRGARTSDWIGLINGNSWRHPFHLVHRRLVHAVQELSGIGTECLDITPLAFSKQRVKHQTGLPRSTGPCDNGQLTGANVQINVFEIVLTSTANLDKTVGHKGKLCGWRPNILGLQEKQLGSDQH